MLCTFLLLVFAGFIVSRPVTSVLAVVQVASRCMVAIQYSESAVAAEPLLAATFGIEYSN
jgi:hypothetical protein